MMSSITTSYISWAALLFELLPLLFYRSKPSTRASNLALCTSSISWISAGAFTLNSCTKLPFPVWYLDDFFDLVVFEWSTFSLTSCDRGRPSGVSSSNFRDGVLAMKVWYDCLVGVLSRSNRFESLRRPPLFKLKWLSSSCNNYELVLLSEARAPAYFKSASGIMFFSNFANPSSIFFFSVSYDSTTKLPSLDCNFLIFGIYSDAFLSMPGKRDGLVSEIYKVSSSWAGELGRVLWVVLEVGAFFKFWLSANVYNRLNSLLSRS